MNKRAKIVFISFFALIVLCLSVYLILLDNYSSNNQSQSNSQLTTKFDEYSDKLIELNKVYEANDQSKEISSNLVSSDFIKISDFCTAMDLEIDGDNKIKVFGFTFDCVADGFSVKYIGGELFANIYVISGDLGYDCQQVNDNYVLGRIFATKRLFVNNPSDNFGAKDSVKFDDFELLQYESEFECYCAYNKFIENGNSVEIDFLTQVDELAVEPAGYFDEQECSVWAGQIMGFDTYKNYLENISVSNELNEFIVAVFDSGLNNEHNLFKNRICSEYARSFTSQGVYDDTVGHGTHVAGTIAYWTLDNVKILPIRIVGSTGKGSKSDLLLACYYIRDLLDSGVNIKALNCSFGIKYPAGYQYSVEKETDTLYIAIKKITDLGVSVCVSAGNDKATNYLDVPAVYENVVTISAISDSKNIANFSNYGKIDFCAPGVNISSASNDGIRGYVNKSGTSMACPHAVASFALMYSNPLENYTHQNILNIFKTQCAIDLGDSGRDEKYGYGLVNLSILTFESSGQPYKTYKILPVLLDANHNEIVNKNLNTYYYGHIGMQYYQQNNKIHDTEFKSSYTADSQGIVKTNRAIHLYCYANLDCEFFGWYYSTQKNNFDSAQLLSKSTYYKLDLNRLTDQSGSDITNYIYVVIDYRQYEINISFVYEDVDDYVGFASFGTEIKCNYKNSNNVYVSETYKSSYQAKDQVITMYSHATRRIYFEITCENDSVVNRIIYVDDKTYSISNINTSTYTSPNTGLYISPYNQTRRFSIVIIIYI